MERSKSHLLLGRIDLSKIKALKTCLKILSKRKRRQYKHFCFYSIFMNSVLYLDVLKTSLCNQELIRVHQVTKRSDMAS